MKFVGQVSKHAYSPCQMYPNILWHSSRTSLAEIHRFGSECLSVEYELHPMASASTGVLAWIQFWVRISVWDVQFDNIVEFVVFGVADTA
jgi:hypothetical protein